MSEPTKSISVAPWSEAQVAALVLRQDAIALHPYVCPYHAGVPLTPTRHRLECRAAEGCGYIQTWVNRLDVDEPEWWRAS